MGWALWRARYSKISLTTKDGHTDHILRTIPHNQRVELLRRGWVLRPEWLRLEREASTAPQLESPVEPGFVRVTRPRSCLTHQPQFDPSITMTDEDGSEYKLLDDPLSEDYLVFPGETCKAGMLPPCEFEIRALCWDVLILNTHALQLTFADRLWNMAERRARVDVLYRTATDLNNIVKRSREDRAAFLRVCGDWRENDMCVPEPFFQSFMRILSPMEQWYQERP